MQIKSDETLFITAKIRKIKKYWKCIGIGKEVETWHIKAYLTFLYIS